MSIEDSVVVPSPGEQQGQQQEGDHQQSQGATAKKKKVKKEKGGAGASAAVATPPVAPSSEDGKEGGASSDNGDLAENAYVTVMSKKIRGLRKKLEQVRILEQQLGTGKVRLWHHLRRHVIRDDDDDVLVQALNEEQRIKLSSKTYMEKLLKDLEVVRQQLLEVAREEPKPRQVRQSVIMIMTMMMMPTGGGGGMMTEMLCWTGLGLDMPCIGTRSCRPPHPFDCPPLLPLWPRPVRRQAVDRHLQSFAKYIFIYIIYIFI
jgi:hypothetical protein